MTEIEVVSTPVVEAQHLYKEFQLKGGLLGRTKAVVRSVNDVSFQIGASETLGLVGESGSGKSTTARLILRLLAPTSGNVLLDGVDVTQMKGRSLRQARSDMQAVFQDITGALNAGMTVAEIVGEPLKLHKGMAKKERRQVACEMLERVGLRRDYLDRYPYELSGGQRQRVGIARALVLKPKLVVLDEPVSALDVSTQSQVINLLEDLQEELGCSYLFIAHNLYVVHHISRRIAVMYLGSVVELGDATQVYERPRHPYSQALLSAIPEPDPAAERNRQPIVLHGDVPGPSSVPSGCAFHTRCPYVMDVCRSEVPPTTTFADGGSVACHLHTTGPDLAGETVNVLPRPVERTPVG